MAPVKVVGVESIKGIMRSTCVEMTDSSRARCVFPRASSPRFTSAPLRRASWASNHVDNMLDDAPEAADLLGFY